jgi:hypothetical protein
MRSIVTGEILTFYPIIVVTKSQRPSKKFDQMEAIILFCASFKMFINIYDVLIPLALHNCAEEVPPKFYNLE